MSSNGNDQSLYAAHQAAWEDLPWYVNGTLESAELERVERHVANCVACRSEIKYLRQLAGLVQSVEQPAPSGSAGLSAVMERIERLERGTQPLPFASPAAKLARFLRSRFNQPRVLRRMLVVQAAVILILVALAVWPARTSAPPTYRTLSDAVGESTEQGVRLRLVFSDRVSERQIRELLRFVDGEIVGGPSEMGVYTVRLAAPPDDARLAALLEELRASPQVQFAEVARVPGTQSTENPTDRR